MSTEKTFAPSPRKRQKAREEGRVAISRDLVNALLLLVGTTLLWAFGKQLLAIPLSGLETSFTETPWTDMTPDRFLEYWNQWMGVLFTGFLPFLLVLPLTVLLGTLLQTRFLFLPSKLLPDWNHLKPRLISVDSCVASLLGVAKIGLVAGILCWAMLSRLEEVLALPTMPLDHAVETVYDVVLLTGWKVAGVLFLLALADYGWQYWRHEQNLKMTLEEVREEQKIAEGDPHLKAKIREKIQRI
ncbi:MAG: EscU/YscU/HrcU family type III secretion system export apparatus switch protein [Planctomycetia bacterium]|nr:EscU/YscU/HrcU family type III secretion system export apparatus switch protein [Planctomycetia bacterium]